MTELRHVGVMIGEELRQMGCTVTLAAKLIGMSRPTLSHLVNATGFGLSVLKPSTALKLERVFGFDAETIMANHALWLLMNERANPDLMRKLAGLTPWEDYLDAGGTEPRKEDQ